MTVLKADAHNSSTSNTGGCSGSTGFSMVSKDGGCSAFSKSCTQRMPQTPWVCSIPCMFGRSW